MDALLCLWHSISCLLACHWLVIEFDANLSLTSHLLLLFWTAFMSHIWHFILVSHHLPPENKAVLSVLISPAQSLYFSTLMAIFYYKTAVYFSAGPRFQPFPILHLFCSVLVLSQGKKSHAGALSSSSCGIVWNSGLPYILCVGTHFCTHCI